MSVVRVYVPRDSAAVSVGADRRVVAATSAGQVYSFSPD